jgi:hypothetical protein
MTDYSASTDLLTGNIPLPAALNAAKFVSDAADEIDSIIGFVYQTPIDVTITSVVDRPARLLLKRISNWLASGRLILAVDSGGEDTTLHAYGLKLVNDALMALNAIAAGEVVLQGAVQITPAVGTVGPQSAPTINNLDALSQVEEFYDAFNPQNPLYPWVDKRLWVRKI